MATSTSGSPAGTPARELFDPGYPASIAVWGWPSGFGADGIDAALYSGTKCYFFDGNQYIRVTRGDTGPGTVDPGYPASIAVWGWPSGFGTREFILIHFKSLVSITSTVSSFMDTQFSELAALYAGSGIEARRGTTEDLSGDTTLSSLQALDVGQCLLGQPTTEQTALFAHRNNAGPKDLVIYVVQSLVGGAGNFVGCATHPAGQPGAAIVQNSAKWLMAHEVGHVLGLLHVASTPTTNSDFLMWPNTSWTNPPPDISASEATTMQASNLSRPF